MSHLGILAYGLDLFDTQPGMQLGNNAALTRFSIEAGKMFRISGRLNTSELRSYSRKHCANCDCERYRCKVFYREAVRTHSPAVFQYRCPSGCEVVTIIWQLTGCHHNQEEVTVLTLEVAAPGRTAGMFGYGSSAGFEQLLRLYPWTLGDTGKSPEKPSLPGSASSGFREARPGTFIRPVLSIKQSPGPHWSTKPGASTQVRHHPGQPKGSSGRATGFLVPDSSHSRTGSIPCLQLNGQQPVKRPVSGPRSLAPRR